MKSNSLRPFSLLLLALLVMLAAFQGAACQGRSSPAPARPARASPLPATTSANPAPSALPVNTTAPAGSLNSSGAIGNGDANSNGAATENGSISDDSQSTGSTPAATAIPDSATATAIPTPLPALQPPLRWVLRGEPPADLALVNERLNRELALRGFNAQVELHVLPAPAFERTLAEMEAAGRPFDLLAFSGDRYLPLIEAGALLPFRGPHALPEQVTHHLPAAAWTSLQQGGVVYAVPVESRWVVQRGVTLRADVVQALDLAGALQSAQTFDDLTPIFARIYAAIRDGSLVGLGVERAEAARRVFGQADLLQPELAGYDPLALPFVVRYDDPQLRPLNWYQTPEFRHLAGLRREWQQAGYGPPLPLSPEDILAGYQAGTYLAVVGVPVYPGSAAERAARLGGQWFDLPLSPAFLPSAAPRAALTGLNARLAGDLPRAARALRLLELLHADPLFHNLLVYGIEGQHWTWADRAARLIRPLPGARYHPDFAAQVPASGLAYALSNEQAQAWAQVRQQNAEARPSAALGFTADPRPVAAELAALQGLAPEWLLPLAHGQVVDIDRHLHRMHQALEAAGLPEVELELLDQRGRR